VRFQNSATVPAPIVMRALSAVCLQIIEANAVSGFPAALAYVTGVNLTCRRNEHRWPGLLDIP
jgi:hypothetical protein